jgi:hypothetical protein
MSINKSIVQGINESFFIMHMYGQYQLMNCTIYLTIRLDYLSHAYKTC